MSDPLSPTGIPDARLPFQDLMDQFRAGSLAAGTMLFTRFDASPLRSLIRQSLQECHHTTSDPADFAQTAWKSVWERCRSLPAFDSDTQWLAYLHGVAIHKFNDERRHAAHRQRRLAQPVSLNDPDSASTAEPIDSRSDPVQEAIALELWNRILRDQPARHSKIIQMRLSGETYRRIAQAVQLHEGSVRRIVKKALGPELRD